MPLKNRLKLRNIGFLWDLEEPLPKSGPKKKAGIRAATRKDSERLRKIVVDAYLPEWSWWVRQIGGKERARADLMSYVSKFLRDRKKRIFVAEDSETIIGFCGAAKYDRGTGTIGYGVAVLPGFRKRGIGSMLLLAALDWLKNSGVRFVTLEEETFGFANQDTPAMILYKSLGGKIISDHHATR
ncbi:GNAT family N-acetyltransferase [Candidatus Bathyarchaeota archaeon]|nr:MAG: GNAT family N-acetyltransferase [Candidatus Bathyarchaeota archaeon]